MEPYFLDWLQQFDLSALGDLSELDWSNVATYGTVAVALGGGIWASSKSLVRLIWSKIQPALGFAISSLVVFSLWYSVLRVHLSVSFNLDKELFDNLLWLSALSFTPYYLVHYNLLTGFFWGVVRSVELLADLLVFSWFPQRAEHNRNKWRTRAVTTYETVQQSVTELWQKALSATRGSQVSVEVDAGEQV